MIEDQFPSVTFGLGEVRGRVEHNAPIPVATFFGLPYAQPPVGPLRWRAPQRIGPWSDVRDAFSFGPDLPQGPNPNSRAPSQSEDCLYLNIWTPLTALREKNQTLPVMCWIHGGGFMGGSASDLTTDGTQLAASGVVVVSFNYRAGLFGFLAHPALTRESPYGASGNYGLLDQLMALHWVREHIANFGGNPQCLTVFGVSAGSASISLLLTSPLAAGAFDRAILESPGAARPLASLEQAQNSGLLLGDDVDALRALSAGDLFSKSSVLNPKVRGLTTPRVLRPIRDGYVITEDERPAFEAGRIHSMPIIVGTNSDEGTLLTQAWPIKTLVDYGELLRANFGEWALEASDLYQANDDEDVSDCVAQLFADTQFNFGSWLLARSMAKKNKCTWRYLFTLKGPDQSDGPHHGQEVPYVFGNLRAASKVVPQQSQLALSDAMLTAWVAFARTGNPNTTGATQWPSYTEQDDQYWEFGQHQRVAHAWHRPQLQFLERFFVQQGA